MASANVWAPHPSARLVTISKCDHAGQEQIRYPGAVLFADEHIVASRCIWRMHRTYTLGQFAITDGDILIEYYYRHCWYNVFAVYASTGTLKGWYCNVTYPTLWSDTSLSWHDLALDLVVLPDGTQHVLDQDEFANLPISPSDRHAATTALAELQAMASANAWPLRPAP